MEGVRQGLLTGRGRVVLRGKCHVDTKARDGSRSSSPKHLTVNRDNLTDRIGQLVNDKPLKALAHVNNE